MSEPPLASVGQAQQLQQVHQLQQAQTQGEQAQQELQLQRAHAKLQTDWGVSTIVSAWRVMRFRKQREIDKQQTRDSIVLADKLQREINKLVAAHEADAGVIDSLREKVEADAANARELQFTLAVKSAMIESTKEVASGALTQAIATTTQAGIAEAAKQVRFERVVRFLVGAAHVKSASASASASEKSLTAARFAANAEVASLSTALGDGERDALRAHAELRLVSSAAYADWEDALCDGHASGHAKRDAEAKEETRVLKEQHEAELTSLRAEHVDKLESGKNEAGRHLREKKEQWREEWGREWARRGEAQARRAAVAVLTRGLASMASDMESQRAEEERNVHSSYERLRDVAIEEVAEVRKGAEFLRANLKRARAAMVRLEAQIEVERLVMVTELSFCEDAQADFAAQVAELNAVDTELMAQLEDSKKAVDELNDELAAVEAELGAKGGGSSHGARKSATSATPLPGSHSATSATPLPGSHSATSTTPRPGSGARRPGSGASRPGSGANHGASAPTGITAARGPSPSLHGLSRSDSRPGLAGVGVTPGIPGVPRLHTAYRRRFEVCDRSVGTGVSKILDRVVATDVAVGLLEMEETEMRLQGLMDTRLRLAQTELDKYRTRALAAEEVATRRGTLLVAAEERRAAEAKVLCSSVGESEEAFGIVSIGLRGASKYAAQADVLLATTRSALVFERDTRAALESELATTEADASEKRLDAENLRATLRARDVGFNRSYADLKAELAANTASAADERAEAGSALASAEARVEHLRQSANFATSEIERLARALAVMQLHEHQQEKSICTFLSQRVAGAESRARHVSLHHLGAEHLRGGGARPLTASSQWLPGLRQRSSSAGGLLPHAQPGAQMLTLGGATGSTLGTSRATLPGVGTPGTLDGEKLGGTPPRGRLQAVR
ncbi:hypothetical protein T492DRAFT_1151257 [Pavlovales sp. CCMP2436]|nr:hypothetical protein T492DRAFT_1151257 [Pavlovales sp. CCMP2436]